MKERNMKKTNDTSTNSAGGQKQKVNAIQAKKLFETNMSMQVSYTRRIMVVSFINGMLLIAWSLNIIININKQIFIPLQILTLLLWDIFHLYKLKQILVESISINELLKSIKEGYNTDKFDINMRGLYQKLMARFNESLIAFCLGAFFGLTTMQVLKDIFTLTFEASNYSKLGIFISSLGLYHFMEYMYKAEYHHYDLNWHDFQIDHSKAYGAAMFACVAEFGVK